MIYPVSSSTRCKCKLFLNSKKIKIIWGFFLYISIEIRSIHCLKLKKNVSALLQIDGIIILIYKRGRFLSIIKKIFISKINLYFLQYNLIVFEKYLKTVYTGTFIENCIV